MYINTGKGGSFFREIYFWMGIPTLREKPVTKEDFLKYGSNERVFSDYLSYVKRLYCEFFIANNDVVPKDDVSATLPLIWEDFIDFCIDNNLMLEFADSEGNRMHVPVPEELKHFRFIYQYPEYPDAIHICTLDEFRYELEIIIGEVSEDWYLNYRYDISITNGITVRYDSDTKKDVPLTIKELGSVLSKIKNDLYLVEEKISQHKTNTPVRTIDITRETFADSYRLQRDWIEKRIELDKEYVLVSDCVWQVSWALDEYIESCNIDNNSSAYTDDTLYIYKGQIVCLYHNHKTEQATAILMNRDGKDIELNVTHCLECDKFFMEYNTYLHYRKKYGTILGNVRMVKNGDFSDVSYELADESPLRLCGYTVSQKAGLSMAERQTIIESCIVSGAMQKEDIIHLLNWFLDVNGAKIGNELAYQKWCDDLDFVLAYNTPRQNQYRVAKIERYRRNRFYINDRTKETSLNNQVAYLNYVGKKVKHKSEEFGVGVVVSQADDVMTVEFENGKKTQFLYSAFSDNILKLI